MAAPAAAPVPAAAAPALPTFKVFVGNLSFKTREGELQKAFSGAGNVYAIDLLMWLDSAFLVASQLRSRTRVFRLFLLTQI